MMLLKKVLFWLIMSLSYFSLSTAHATNVTLNLSKTGNGQVYGSYYYNSNTSGSGISCGAGCTVTTPTTVAIESGSQISLSASTSDANYIFQNWTGGVCNNSTSPSCEFAINQNPTNLTANFRQLSSNRVKVIKNGAGIGDTQLVNTIPSGASVITIAQNGYKIYELPNSTTGIRLTATPQLGYTFNQWSGCDSVYANGDCKVNSAPSERVIIATFGRPNYVLTVNKNNSNGIVTSYDSSSSGSGIGINCGVGCPSQQAVYLAGEYTSLQSQATSTSVFLGWGNAQGNNTCDGASYTFLSGYCWLNPILANRTVVARFRNRLNKRIEVTKSGTGSGTISFTPTSAAGYSNCAQNLCVAEYSANTSVTVVAHPNAGSAVNWISGCTPVAGNPTQCIVYVNDLKDIQMTFTAVPYNLSVTTQGNGVVQDYNYATSPSGISVINCGPNTTCNSTLMSGSSITLKANPNTGSTFSGWNGDCTGYGTQNTCSLFIDSNKNVGASFTP